MARAQLRGTLEYDRGRKAGGASISDELAKLGPPDGMSVTVGCSEWCARYSYVCRMRRSFVTSLGGRIGARCYTRLQVTVYCYCCIPFYYDPNVSPHPVAYGKTQTPTKKLHVCR